jgi:hypothetical protein
MLLISKGAAETAPFEGFEGFRGRESPGRTWRRVFREPSHPFFLFFPSKPAVRSVSGHFPVLLSVFAPIPDSFRFNLTDSFRCAMK